MNKHSYKTPQKFAPILNEDPKWLQIANEGHEKHRTGQGAGVVNEIYLDFKKGTGTVLIDENTPEEVADALDLLARFIRALHDKEHLTYVYIDEGKLFAG